jgi:hypothetical protein
MSLRAGRRAWSRRTSRTAGGASGRRPGNTASAQLHRTQPLAAGRCRVLWQELRHPEYDLTSPRCWSTKQPHLMPMVTPFDGYVEDPGAGIQHLPGQHCPQPLLGALRTGRGRWSASASIRNGSTSSPTIPWWPATPAASSGARPATTGSTTSADRAETRRAPERRALRRPAGSLAAPARLLLKREGGDRVMAKVLAAVPRAGLEAVLVAVELVLESGNPVPSTSRTCSTGSTRRRCPREVETLLQVKEAPLADTGRYDRLRRKETAMRDLARTEILRLYGMAGAWADLVAQGGAASLAASRWLVEHLLQAEHTDRAMRSIALPDAGGPLPGAPDLAGFDFESVKVDRRLISELADLAFTEAAHNVVFIGGPVPARRIWPPPWAFPGSPGTASGCASSRRWIWSMPWSRRRRSARPGGSALASCAWTW